MRNYHNWEKKTRENATILKQVKKRIHALMPNAEIIFYGSRARGESTSHSDWDFLILSDNSITQSLLTAIKSSLYDLELETGQDLSSIIRNKKEWNSPKYAVLPFKKEVDEEGIIL